jgi:type II secretory ATPase GspE/PulE/Tfp pilus assembly ATPase PilB-like protein
MVLDALSSSLKGTLQKIAKAIFVDEKLLNELVKDIQRALLQADVNVKLVFDLTNRIKERAQKEVPAKGLTKREQLINVVYEELVRFLGGEKVEVSLDRKQRIMLVGLFGSGKTTTLYAFLKEIQKPEIKIITIEDPIEYHLDGVSQTQVHPEKGYDFASGLQAIVRQDPDVILVGEIRDKATAQIALQAALTGHLVFSTLHTNDAPGTIPRLISLEAKPVNIGAASNVIIGQRLIRKVCARCAVFTKITAEELAQIKKGLQGIKDAQVSSLPPTLKLARTQGCKECNSTGYKGRIGVFEMILVDGALEEFILTKPSTAALRQFVIKQGMTTMYQDGLLKIVQGVTTLDELLRTTGEEET